MSINANVISFIQCIFFSVAVIGFVPDTYNATEGVDQLVNLNVQLISGQLGREVIVIIDTQSGTATSRQ